MKKINILLLTISILFALTTHSVESKKVYVDVNGLVCDFCARALEKVFGKQKSVESINVDLDKKVVTVEFKKGKTLNDKTISKLIKDSGYEVVKIRHTSGKTKK